MKNKVLVFLIIFFGLLSFGINVHASDNNLYQEIKKRKSIVVGTSADYPPFEFTKQVNGKTKYFGSDIQLAQKIADQLKVKLIIKNMDFSSLLVGLETHKIDIVIAGMNPDPTRLQTVDFSNNYFTAKESLVIRSNDNKIINSYKDLNNRVIGVQTGSVQEKLASNFLPNTKVIKLASVTDLILSLQTKKVDALSLSGGVGQAYAKSVKGLTAINANYPIDSQNESDNNGFSVAIPKNEELLLTKINQIIKAIGKKGYQNFLNKAGKELQNKSYSSKSVAKNKDSSMWNYRSYFIKGLKITLFISFIGVILGFILGSLFGWMSISHLSIFRLIARTYIEIIRGTPLMVQMLFAYFGIGTLFNLSSIISGIIAISVNSAAYVAEIIRGGINSVDTGQKEASLSMGLNSKQAMRYIIFPQAIKNIWPSLGNEFITLIKESSIVSMIGVPDLIYQLKNVQANTYRGIAPIVVVFFIYLTINFLLGSLLRFIEKKFK
ncbi:MAG: ABC transporter substrate-binding protein/permease [Lactobacillaceae bacterium]|jgi:polar amino acid transport system substrate-binding protein|nr:ABC transporter substrate-binding protein/permease [Lactobacillaceae bacterium]